MIAAACMSMNTRFVDCGDGCVDTHHIDIFMYYTVVVLREMQFVHALQRGQSFHFSPTFYRIPAGIRKAL